LKIRKPLSLVSADAPELHKYASLDEALQMNIDILAHLVSADLPETTPPKRTPVVGTPAHESI
jgi:hypothetical protein